MRHTRSPEGVKEKRRGHLGKADISYSQASTPGNFYIVGVIYKYVKGSGGRWGAEYGGQ